MKEMNLEDQSTLISGFYFLRHKARDVLTVGELTNCGNWFLIGVTESFHEFELYSSFDVISYIPMEPLIMSQN